MNATDIEALRAALAELPCVAWRGGYSQGIGLCVLDAVFSVNANYESTISPMIARFRVNTVGANTLSAAGLLSVIVGAGGPDGFASQLRNRQRTSTRNGILKAAAVQDAAAALVRQGVDSTADLKRLIDEGALEPVETAWRSVRGQSSGVTWRYFLMLAGIPGVKPDRMILRFLATALNRKVTPHEAVDLVARAAELTGMNATEADHRIWSAESEKARMARGARRREAQVDPIARRRRRVVA